MPEHASPPTGKSPSSLFRGRLGAIATMHRKEQVMAPVLQQGLNIETVIPTAFDTDAFGTFTRDIERAGSQREAARHKAEAALKLTETTLAFASEGTFGPHPSLPFLPCNRELVLLLDVEHGLELVGEAVSTQTNFRHQLVTRVEDALAFAKTIGFPEHGLVVRLDPDTSPDTGIEAPIHKGIVSKADLVTAVEWAIATAPNSTAHLETDMRAMMNPTRMAVIAEATHDLVRRIHQTCPQCHTPGFDVVRQLPGLPCELCSIPTSLIRTAIYQCHPCGFQHELLFPNGISTADPAHCSYCNP
ncbi:MAG: DUF6671 family protein [Elainellaceae cyanobacterium]